MQELQVLVNDKPVRKFYDNHGNTWVEAREGSSFSLKVSNNGLNRKLAIVSVDGLNIINAKHESPHSSPGYIINGHSSITLKGWSISSDEVRKFFFTVHDNESYSRKVGANPENIGVIAVAFFDEKVRYSATWTYNTPLYYDYTAVPPYDYYNSTTSVYHSSDTRTITVNNASVGAGEKEEFRTEETSFVREGSFSVVSIYYDTWEGLVRRGIVEYDKQYRAYPKPFPETAFCPDI